MQACKSKEQSQTREEEVRRCEVNGSMVVLTLRRRYKKKKKENCNKRRELISCLIKNMLVLQLVLI